MVLGKLYVWVSWISPKAHRSHDESHYYAEHISLESTKELWTLMEMTSNKWAGIH